jgi:hypothetical protein
MSAIDVIPPITDPLGKYWDQPPREAIEIDDTHALMTYQTMKKLHNYESTIPTGVYPGKIWRRKDQLCWFDVHEDPKLCSIYVRDILVV